MALCVNCDKEVELDSHGRCVSCGSSSVLTPRAVNSKSPSDEESTTSYQILEAAKKAVVKLGERDKFTDRLALLLITAREHQIRGCPRGLYLELVLDMWDLAKSLEEGERGN